MISRALGSAQMSQLVAADPKLSVFVTANAGSGKTKVLVDRIARLLLEGSKPSAFLCITYTKAAAAEMQRRLFERLGGWCVADNARLASELAALGAAPGDLGRARALFAQALETPGGLKIQTIHAFCERLLARFPLEAGVPPGFEIADETRAAALLGQARASAALSNDAPVAAFRRFAARLAGDDLDALMDRLAARRGAFRNYSESRQGPIFADAALKNRHGVKQSADSYAASALAGVDWGDLRLAAEALSSSSANNQKTARRIVLALDAQEARAAPRVTLESLLRVALKEDNEPYEALVTASFAAERPRIAHILDPIVELAARAREALNAIDRAEDAAAALALALKLDQSYGDAKARVGALDFDDLIEHAQALLRRSDSAAWVLYKLDGGIDHILIDEGQDTSPTQWDLIAPLQNEFFAGRGARERARTVFAVGDPKQSIYAFQGADPRRFLREKQILSKRAGQSFAAPDLLTSFRSAPEILRVVDATFNHRPLIDVAPSHHDLIEHLAARETEQGAVEVWPLAMRPAAQPAQAWDAPMDVETGASAHAILARAIAQRVCDMIAARETVWEQGAPRPLRAGDVLALVRTRGPLFRELIKAFKRAGLPVAGADRMVLREELAVEDCLALLRVALDPADDLSLACLLKGPWLNLDDDDTDLFPLAYGRAKGEALYVRLMAAADVKYDAAREFVGGLIARRGDDAFAFLSWALETPDHAGATGWEKVFARLGPEARDPLEELLQRALKPSAHAAATLQRFLHDIDSDAGQVKRELEAETGAVRVMTVHGAKGLEAPLVILPDTSAGVEDAPDNGLIFDDAEGPFISFRGKDDDKAVRDARAAHKARMLGEHWRLLYVAMTRARDRLIVCGAQWRNTEAPESWRLAVQEALAGLGAGACETPFGEGVRFGTPLVASATTARVAAIAPPAPDWVRTSVVGAHASAAIAPSRAAHFDATWFSPRGEGQLRFRRGRLIHGLLQRLPEIASERRAEAAHAWLQRQGAGEDEAQSYVREALSVIADPRFAAVFGSSSRGEAPIVGTVAGRAVSGIVDRIAFDDASVILLDFKTDRPAPRDPDAAPERYVLQLALYRSVLRQIFPTKAIKCALLWTEAPHLMALSDERQDAALATYLRG
ncbi:MAG: double-strand break repair helicase AddA [Terricaulis sp.]